MGKGITKLSMQSTIVNPNKGRIEVNEPWPETSPMRLDALEKETDWTWIIDSPFPKEAQLEYPILELYLHPRTGALVATPTGALSLKQVHGKEKESINVSTHYSLEKK